MGEQDLYIVMQYAQKGDLHSVIPFLSRSLKKEKSKTITMKKMNSGIWLANSSTGFSIFITKILFIVMLKR